MKQVPVIAKSPLTGRWHCITKYKVVKNGIVEAKERFDVHGQIAAIIEEAIAAKKKRKAK